MRTVQNKSFGIPDVGRDFRKRTLMMRLKIVLCAVLLVLAFGNQEILGQGVGISESTITPDGSAILELQSSLRGFLAPRMTTALRTAIGSPANGLLVYDTDLKSFWYYDAADATWKAFPSVSVGWGTSNQLLGMNNAGNGNEYKTLNGSANIVVTFPSAGNILINTIQPINTGATPTFAGLRVTGLTPDAGVYTNGTSWLTSTPPSTGIIGYWNRTGTILSPSNPGDNVTTSGNISTTGIGTITAAGLLTGQAGATISGGTINLNNNSNYVTNINTGGSTGNVTIGNASSSLYLPKFTTPGLLHNTAAGLVTSGPVDLAGGSNFITGILPLSSGGTSANLTASNGGIVWSNATQFQILPGTPTAYKILFSGATGSPSWSAYIMPPSFGGAGEIMYTSNGTTVTNLAAGTAGYYLRSNGGAAPSWNRINLASSGEVMNVLPIANGGTNSGTALSGQSIMISNSSAIVQGQSGTTTTVLHGNALGAPTYGPVTLTTDITGTLPVFNGGTGLTTFGGTNTVLYTSAPDILTYVPASTAPGQFLQTNSLAGVPTWKSILSVANGGTNSSVILNNNRLMVSSGGSIVEASELGTGEIIVGLTGGAPQLVPLGGDATIDVAGALTLASTGVVVGPYGDATHVGQFTVDDKGRLTNAIDVLITGVSPVGSSLGSGNI
ncbi:MAG: hypothetical protein NTW82_13735, partial [Bacteroidia bacterium]|nr:hypothetical protein [Bacteroidia bacterium]